MLKYHAGLFADLPYFLFLGAGYVVFVKCYLPLRCMNQTVDATQDGRFTGA
jgi:hypothetical protein